MSAEWRQNFERALRHSKFKEYLDMETVILRVLLQQKTLSGLSTDEFNRLIVDAWNDANVKIPQIDETDNLYFIIPRSIVDYWKALPFDIFKKIVFDQDIRGKDLLSLCVSHPEISQICDHREQEIFRILLERDYGVLNAENPREEYLEYSQGTLWTFGSGAGGKLGHGGGDSDDLLVPTRIPILRGVVDVSCKSNLMAVLDRDGRVFVWGSGLLKENMAIRSPNQIPNIPPIKKISCGSNHLVMLDREGQIWTYGTDVYQDLLGGGVVSASLTLMMDRSNPRPQKVPRFRNVKEIAAASTITLFLDEEGRVWQFGEAVRFGGQRVDRPVPVSNHRNVQTIACGHHHYALLDEKGQVWMWGDDDAGQLGLSSVTGLDAIYHPPVLVPTMIPNFVGIRQISCGKAHTGFIDARGQVWTFGRGSSYETGHHIRQNISIPRMLPEIEGARQIACGVFHSALINAEGEVRTFGSGDHGILGHGTERRRGTPKTIRGFKNVKKVVCGRDVTAFIL